MVVVQSSRIPVVSTVEVIGQRRRHGRATRLHWGPRSCRLTGANELMLSVSAKVENYTASG